MKHKVASWLIILVLLLPMIPLSLVQAWSEVDPNLEHQIITRPEANFIGFYNGLNLNTGSYGIGMAVSEYGLHWTRNATQLPSGAYNKLRAPQAVLLDNGSIYVYADQAQGDQIVMWSTHNNGSTWSQPQLLFSGYRTAILYNSSWGDHAFQMWDGESNSPSSVFPRYRYSSDGISWSGAVTVINTIPVTGYGGGDGVMVEDVYFHKNGTYYVIVSAFSAALSRRDPFIYRTEDPDNPSAYTLLSPAPMYTYENIESTITATVSSGSLYIPVTSTASFSVDLPVFVGNKGQTGWDFRRIAEVTNATHIKLNQTTSQTHAIGDYVFALWDDHFDNIITGLWYVDELDEWWAWGCPHFGALNGEWTGIMTTSGEDWGNFVFNSTLSPIVPMPEYGGSGVWDDHSRENFEMIQFGFDVVFGNTTGVAPPETPPAEEEEEAEVRQPPEVFEFGITEVSDLSYLFYGESYQFYGKYKYGDFSEVRFNDTVNEIVLGYNNLTRSAYIQGAASLLNFDVNFTEVWINCTWDITFTSDILDSESRGLYGASYYGGAASGTAIAGEADWYDTSWGSRLFFSIDHTNIDDTLTNFPVLVYLDTNDVDWGDFKTDLSDIRFTDSDGTTIISHELEKYNSLYNATLWVELPQVSPISPQTEFYMYYDNPSATSNSSTDTFSDYYAVYHLSDEGGTTADSSGNSRTLTEAGTIHDNSASPNRIMGNSKRSAGASNAFYRNDMNDFEVITGDFSVQAWAWFDPVDTIPSTIISKGKPSEAGSGEGGWTVYANEGGNTSLRYEIGSMYNPPQTVEIAYADNIMDDTDWNLITITQNSVSGVGSIYVNGTVQNTLSFTDSITSTATYFAIFGMYDDGVWTDLSIYGMVDEARVDNAVWSAARVKAEYYSQTDQLVTIGGTPTVVGNATEFDGFWVRGETQSIVYDDAWWSTSWSYRKRITTDHTKLLGTVTNFTLPIILDSTNMDWGHINSDGSDIRVIDYESGGTSGAVLPYEIENWDYDNQEAVIWATIPDITNTGTRAFYLYYGNSAAEDIQSEYDAWVGATAVYHLSDSGGTTTDSSVNEETLTKSGTITDDVTAMIGEGKTGDGASGYFYDDSISDFELNSGSFTLQVWVVDETNDVGATDIHVGKGSPTDNEAGNGGWWVGEGNNNHSARIEYGGGGGGSAYVIQTSMAVSNSAHWTLLTMRRERDQNKIFFYINGTEDNQISTSYDADSSDTLFGLFANTNTSAGDRAWSDATLDEVRVYPTAKTPTWIDAEYDAQSNNLLSFASEETYGATYANIPFNIYHLGGRASYTFVGDGARIVGGDVFELEVNTTGSSARANVVWSKLQNIHLLTSINLPSTWDSVGGYWNCPSEHNHTGAVYFGIDYSYDDAWVEGWYAKIQIQDGKAGTYGVSDERAYVLLNITWYNQGTLVKSDSMYALFDSYQQDDAKQTTEIWVDLWFNKINGSRVVGGRVNAEYFGMSESGWFLWSSWAAMISNTTQSMFFGDLEDGSGNIISSKEIELVRVWTKIEKLANGDDGDPSCNEHKWSLSDYDVFEWGFADGYMEGINTPAFVATKSVEVASTGFMTPFITAITSIPKRMLSAITGWLWSLASIGDGFFSLLGLPDGIFTGLIQYFNTLIPNFSGWLSFVVDNTTAVVTMIGYGVTMFTTFISYFLTGSGWFMTNVLQYVTAPIRFFIAFINGGSVVIGDHTLDLSYAAPIMVAVREVAPITGGVMLVYWLFGYEEQTKGMNVKLIPSRFIQMFQFIRDSYEAVFFILVKIKNLIIGTVRFLWGMVPVVGGGGGGEET